MENFNHTTEEDVGITEFVNNDNPGFKCVLKHRYSDFLVNEIDQDGNVVWVKEKDTPPEEEPQKEKEELTEEKANETIAKVFKPIFSNEKDVENLERFVSNYINKQNIINDTIEIEFIQEKEKRKIFHETLRENFPFLDSETKEVKDKGKILIIKYQTKQSFYKRRKVFPDKNKNILVFAMLKRNMDTISAINYIARMLHKSQKLIKFAGNKDKRGITTQKISLFNTLPSEMIAISKSKKWSHSIELGNFSLTDSELRLGLLKGNQFCVVLRFVKMENIDEKLPKIIDSINSNGFINYFGMQRFGVTDIPTNKIGKDVIQKKWREAFIKILSTDSVFEALKQINSELTKDLDKEIFSLEGEEQMKIINDIMKIIPKYTTEFKLLNNYSKSGKNSFQSSFRSLNKQLQVLYPHAYQSYIWNRTVSERIKKHGLNLIIGDIVKKHSALYMEKNQEEDCGLEDENEEKNEEKNEQKDTKESNSKNIFENNFEYITEENKDKFTIHDLVIPIVGYEVCYPKNDTKDFIEELLKEDGLTFKDFEYQAVNFNSTGYFRKVVEKPLNEMKYEVIHHDDPDEDLNNEYYNLHPHPVKTGTKNTAIRIVFQLPQSTYATMLFRELTKRSSAGTYQANLSMNVNKENK